eukprot:TRINITY_DN2153_c0_g1_i1.p1 TRINITY_DN2153_c0_g1~~TRINITY_DN2153_c0_g1_i1.p1  ORF type:complete len:259 (+),score=77.60 TRINITY_DN2153_c0_g1_i1:71-847(+)
MAPVLAKACAAAVLGAIGTLLAGCQEEPATTTTTTPCPVTVGMKCIPAVGSCTLSSCDASRGDTTCKKHLGVGVCECDHDYCNLGGKCVPPTTCITPSYLELLSNGTAIDEMVVKELEYEVQLEASAPKSKVVLALIEMFGLGALGVDRCYMGSTCLGVVKALTGGGFVIWALVDYFNIVFNCLMKKDKIASIGYGATFTPGTVDMAFYIVVGLFALKCIVGCTRAAKGMSGREVEPSDAADALNEQPAATQYEKLVA